MNTPKLPSLQPGTHEQNALWDHIYEYGHTSEGVQRLLEKVCQAYAISVIEAQGVPDGVVLQIDAAVTQAQKVLSDWNEWYGMHGEKAPLPPGGIVKAQELLAVAKSLLASAPPAPQCAGDPGECAYNGACMYACGLKDPPAPQAAIEAQGVSDHCDPSSTTYDLAAMVMSDCGHSTNNQRLLDRIAARIDKHVESLLASAPPAPQAEIVDSKCPNYWDDAYDDLKPGDIQTDCEPAPHEVVEHKSPAPQAEKVAFCHAKDAEQLTLKDAQAAVVQQEPAIDAAAEAFNNTFHKVRAEVSMDWWQRIWAKGAEWARRDTIKLTPAEIQSGLDRVRWAEGLILQLPENHDGRNSWLLNYGTDKEQRQAEWARKNGRANPAIQHLPADDTEGGAV